MSRDGEKLRKLDINGDLVEVGDVIIIPKFGNLSKHVVLGFSENMIILSCYKYKRMWLTGEHYYRCVNNEIEKHEHRYYNDKYNQVLIIQKNIAIPENLRKFVKQF